MDRKTLFRYYGISTAISLLLIGLVGWQISTSAMILALILVGLEITFSFDNAVINAKILRGMSRGWQQAFIWVGIPIAVFGVRIFLPILIVSMIAGTDFFSIMSMAINDPDQYAHLLDEAHYMIASFGGIFLLMLALDFFFEHKKVQWLKPIEQVMMKAGTMESLTVMVALLVIPGAAQLVDDEHKLDVFTAGIVGMFVYLAIRAMNIVLARSGIAHTVASGAKATFKAGLIGFIYLQVVDASFSLDSVIGAFAITKEILIIAVGLGVGAIYVRSITIHMLRSHLLDHYKYMEHGAHYAIIILAGIMILSLKYHIPEYITGLSGVLVISASIWHSIHEKRIKQSANHVSPS